MLRVVACAAIGIVVLGPSRTVVAKRQVIPFDTDWRFAQGSPSRAATMECDDAGWQEVDLPHDWAIASRPAQDADGETGKLPWRGEGWYRKHFIVPATDSGQRVYFLFDGVMAAPTIYVNGKPAGKWDYGYNSFWVDATVHIAHGRDNVIAVHADTRRHTSRWYPGGGIYRKVTMIVCEPVHVAHWGTHVTSRPTEGGQGRATVRTQIRNHKQSPQQVTVSLAVHAPGGRSSIGEAFVTTQTVPAEGSVDVVHEFEISALQPWDLDHPACYTACVEASQAGALLDRVLQPFGVRKAEFTADDGFHLNGRRVQLKGVNLHHDQGPLGAACYPRALERQLRILKEMGVNAIRTSHNPAAPELLDWCDRLGLLVFNELFDCWDASADLYDPTEFEPFMRRNVENFVTRDRNHPSVILWSIGNEIEDVQRLKPGGENERKVAFMVELFKQHDPARPVTMACHREGALETAILDALDVQSWNYTRKYGLAKKRYPTKPVVCSESAAAVSVRDFYSLPFPAKREDFRDAAERQVSSYDLNSPWWSDIADVEFARQAADRFCAGEFVWSGFDYLGEPLPFDDAWARETGGGTTTLATRNSQFGIVDLCGIPKDRYYLYRSHWAPEKPTLHIVPHWNWPDRFGKMVPVFVYTNGDEAELFLNGKSLGRRHKNNDTGLPGSDSDYYAIIDRHRLRWEEVRYEPGELKVVAYRDGTRIGTAMRRTAGAPTALRLTPDRRTIAADGRDLGYLLVEMIDAEGTVCPLAKDWVKYVVDGPARIAGAGNGNPTSLESFVGNEHALSYGKAMLIARSRRGEAGPITVTAEANGVQSAVATLNAE